MHLSNRIYAMFINVGVNNLQQPPSTFDWAEEHPKQFYSQSF